MTDAEPSSGVRALLWATLAAIGLLFCIGGIVGFLSAHDAGGGGPLSVAALAVLGCFAALGATCVYAIWRQVVRTRRLVLAQNRANVSAGSLRRFFAPSALPPASSLR